MGRGVAAGLVLLLALGACGSDTVAVPPPTPAGAVATACAHLVSLLPRDIDADLRGRNVTPSSPYTRAWGHPAATLRCGVARPSSFTDTEQLQIGHVCWGSPDVVGSHISWHPRDGSSPYVEMDLPSSVSAANALAPVSDHLTPSTCTGGL